MRDVLGTTKDMVTRKGVQDAEYIAVCSVDQGYLRKCLEFVLKVLKVTRAAKLSSVRREQTFQKY